MTVLIRSYESTYLTGDFMVSRARPLAGLALLTAGDLL